MVNVGTSFFFIKAKHLHDFAINEQTDQRDLSFSEKKGFCLTSLTIDEASMMRHLDEDRQAGIRVCMHIHTHE